MRFVLISILLLNYVYADLQSKIILKAQTACFLKNPSNGLSASDYSPTVTTQTLRQSIESTHTSTQSQSTCDSWLLDPYVNVDTETYQVIANMDCSVNSEQVTTGSGEYETTTTYYWTAINQYALDIDCQESCEVPRDSNGNIYDFTPYISETDCTVPNLQQLVLAEDPNSLYTIVDAQYLNCVVNSVLTGCFYKKTINFDGNTDSNSTDTNSTDNNSNSSNGDAGSSSVDGSTFDDKRIVESNNTTQAIRELIDMDRDKLGDDEYEMIDINGTFNGLSELIDDLESSFSDIRNSFTNVYEPNIQHYNSCVYNFSIMNQNVPIDLCEKLSFLRPYLVFIFTLYFLYLTFRIHLFFISVLMTKYG